MSQRKAQHATKVVSGTGNGANEGYAEEAADKKWKTTGKSAGDTRIEPSGFLPEGLFPLDPGSAVVGVFNARGIGVIHQLAGVD